MIVRATKEMISRQTAGALPALAAKENTGVIQRYRICLLCGEFCVLFRFSRTWLIICATLQADENAPERPPSAYVIFSNSERRRSSIEVAY